MMLTSEQRATIQLELELIAALRDAVLSSSEHGPRPDLRAPCFAHLRINAAGRRRDLLLGFQTLIPSQRRQAAPTRVTLLDWRTAPLAAVFFNYEVGEEYEEELSDRVIRGTVELKCQLEFSDGQLIGITTAEAVLRRAAGDAWQAEPLPAPRRLEGGAGSPARRQMERDPTGRKVPVVTDLLDQQQREILARDHRRPLLIMGGAGCGKTTVALHRLARLHQIDPNRFAQRQMMVVVPEPGLARLSKLILEELGLDRVGVLAFDQWITREAQRTFRDLPRRVCSDPPGRVVKLKRHPALRAVLPTFIERLTLELARRLDLALAGRGAVAQALLGSPGETPLSRLERCEAQLLRDSPRHLHHGIQQACGAERRRLHLAREDLLQLFGDGDLMQRVVQSSAAELGQATVTDLLNHTRVQFSETAEQAFAHVDADRLEAMDGRSLDDGTPQETAQTVDVEDFAVCFELLRLKTGGLNTGSGRLKSYAHLVIDEAQDLAPIELAVLGRTLRRGGNVTISGDQSQHIDPGVCFTSWQRALQDLGLEHTDAAELTTSYRCPAPITRFAHEVLGPLAPREMPRPVRDGAAVERSCCPSEAHAAHELIRALGELLHRDPGASVAVVARDTEGATRLHQVLQRSLPARRVQRGEFSFTPGIDVTDVSQVKGLEFDVVVIPDATPRCYPDQPDARRKLHVACTRAIHQLWVMAVGRFSPIVPGGAGGRSRQWV